MPQRLVTLCISFVVILLLLTAGSLFGLDQEVVFQDDFSGGSMENWMLTLGDWHSENNSFCTISCGT
jgi:ABC-type transport system involved in cytochrome c biogenesis permease component